MKSDERDTLMRVDALVKDLHAAMSEEKKGTFPQPRLAALAAAIDRLSADVEALSHRVADAAPGGGGNP